MLSQDSWQVTAGSNGGNPITSHPDDGDIQALRAAYHAVVTASAHSVFSSKILSPNQQPVSEPLLNAYQAAVAAFANSVFTSSELPTEMKPELNFQPSQPTLAPAQIQPASPEPVALIQNPVQSAQKTEPTPRLKAGQHSQWLPSERRTNREIKPNATLPKVQSAPKQVPLPPLNETLYTPPQTVAAPVLTQSQKVEMNRKIDAFFQTFEPAPIQQAQPAVNQEAAMRAESEQIQQALNLLQADPLADYPDSATLEAEEAQWPTRLLSRPKIVVGVIGLCLLASSLYAGLGYWWLNATGISHAAEPASSVSVQDIHNDTNHLLNNIQSLQEQTHIIIPKETDMENEVLLAEATPAKTFTMNDLKTTVDGSTGRPDPFSPLIDDGTSTGFVPLNDTKQKRDILTDLQYTGFIGDVNSKDKVAIIKVSDPNAGGTVTLIKKAGDIFHVEGELVVLRGISKDNLTLSLSGVNRRLGLNPYADIIPVSNTSGAASNAPGGAPASGGNGAIGNANGPTASTPGGTIANGNNPTPRLAEPGRE